ncbi:MAG: hypothetical protein IJP68_09575 [Selenomonadaceae bacterium]|nr:hypothetical protein [Selenomonadaceae bacterium]
MSRERLKQMAARAKSYDLTLTVDDSRFVLTDNNQPRLTNIYGEELIGEHAEFNSVEELEDFFDGLDGTTEGRTT